MPPTIAYLSNGQLFLKSRDGEPREIHSAFARQVMERQARSQEVNGWKSESGVWGGMGFAAPELADWDQRNNFRTPVRFQGVTRGDEAGHLYYILGVGDMGGLFHYTTDDDSESRLMHRNGFFARDLTRHDATGAIAVAVTKPDGSTGIQVGEKDGRFMREITIGDAVDECPAWIPGEGRRLVYQSAGIGRDQHGMAVESLPYRIELVDLDNEKIDVVHEESGFDLLQPRMTADGTLYCIRRPFEARQQKRTDPIAVLKDIVLFPFRLARAAFHFLNFFSVMFSGKPLSTAAGPQNPVGENRYQMIWGRMIDTRKAMEDAKRKKTSGLVPKEWELIRRDPDGTQHVIVEKVLSFDLCPDGSVLHTDGNSVFLQKTDGETQTLCRDDWIEKVAALG